MSVELMCLPPRVQDVSPWRIRKMRADMLGGIVLFFYYFFYYFNLILTWNELGVRF